MPSATVLGFRLAQFLEFARNQFVRNRRQIWLLCLITALGRLTSASAFDVSYWVWQREEPLTQDELTQLSAQDVHTIYWHVGELENRGDQWQWKTRFPFPPKAPIHFVPVVRLVSHERQPFSPASTSSLVRSLTPAARLTGELQLDYDAPDRLLDDYGRALATIHEITPHLTITALPHWSRPDHLRALAPSVDELFPMLYDFEAEPVLPREGPHALIVPETMLKMLGDWSACPKPWHAGLPTFARLTVYDATGKSRGQIRNWNWDEVCLNHALIGPSKPLPGATVLRAQGPLHISNVRLQTGDQLIVRLVERSALRDAIKAAGQKNARGVTLFRLPDSTASSGWSLAQLSHLEAKPHLTLQPTDPPNALVLTNDSAADLEPRLPSSNQNERGYTVEIAADSPIFREAEAGDFVTVAGSRQTGEGVKRVAIPFATQLVFTFSQLGAGQSLKTGLIQLVPAASFRHARYRVRITKKNGNHSNEASYVLPWQSLHGGHRLCHGWRLVRSSGQVRGHPRYAAGKVARRNFSGNVDHPRRRPAARYRNAR